MQIFAIMDNFNLSRQTLKYHSINKVKMFKPITNLRFCEDTVL